MAATPCAEQINKVALASKNHGRSELYVLGAILSSEQEYFLYNACLVSL
jgi:hypothetical protein